MRLFALAFLSGILILQNFATIPEIKWVWIIFGVGIVLLFYSYSRIIAGCVLGFAWCLLYAHMQMAWTLPENLEGKSILVTGFVASIPNTSQRINSFMFSIKKLQFENNIQFAQGLLRLSWQQNKNEKKQLLRVGDKWQLSVRLKKIHGQMNPGGFDYEAWALHEGIRAKGYVINDAHNKLIDSHWYHYPLTRMREFLKNRIEKSLPLSITSPWITALTLGERHGIAAENWEILRNTGTNHLMAIAGLHIGFMSGFAYAVVAWFWRRRSSLVLKCPAQHAGAIASLAMALIYSALAGFSLPTQRACIMLTVFLLILLLQRKIMAWHAWCVALLLVLLMNPLSVVTESFWLSFGAVALIIYGVSGRLAPNSIWWKWGRIQWVIAVGLVPFSFWLFQQCSIISFVANSIAIPWVGFLVVPLCLVGTFLLFFSTKLGAFILILADKILGILWTILTWFSHLPLASWFHAMPNHWILVIACIGVIIFLFPNGFPGKWLGGIWFLPLFFSPFPIPKVGDVWFTLLDVGQGLTAVVQTSTHILVFDTGAKLSANYDMGESVVVPFLRSIGAKKIDMLVVSHGDNDHIGGSQAILKRFPVASIKTSTPEKFTQPSTWCLQGESWQWDKVNFRFLNPPEQHLHQGNDSSCVLRISSGDKHILLTGDIEKFAEKYLVETESQNLRADILVAPHHGSKTSAEMGFLECVKPQYVLFPIGYRNRYHFPHPSVLAKYDTLNVKKFDTANAGAIQFLVKMNDATIQDPILYRKQQHHFWYQ